MLVCIIDHMISFLCTVNFKRVQQKTWNQGWSLIFETSVAGSWFDFLNLFFGLTQLSEMSCSLEK